MLLLLLGCQEENLAIEIPKEAYEWQCYDKPEYSEINITVGVCNDLDSMTATVLLIRDNFNEISLNYDGGCWWSTNTTQNENCIEIQQVIVTAKGGSDGR